MAPTVKHLPVMRETWVQFLGWEDPLENVPWLSQGPSQLKIRLDYKPRQVES